MTLRGGLDASGWKAKGKGVYQFVDKYGANVDGYSPIYDEKDWSPSGDVYVGGTTGLAIWVVTLLGILAGGALLATTQVLWHHEKYRICRVDGLLWIIRWIGGDTSIACFGILIMRIMPARWLGRLRIQVRHFRGRCWGLCYW